MFKRLKLIISKLVLLNLEQYRKFEHKMHSSTEFTN